jgi:hypothetical protein
MSADRLTTSARVPLSAVGTPSSQQMMAMTAWKGNFTRAPRISIHLQRKGRAGGRVFTGMQRREVEQRHAVEQGY